MNTKKVLLTGATGLIGQKLALKLLQKGYGVHVLTRKVAGAEKKLPLPVTFFEWNPMKEQAPLAAFENVTAVIHLAGESVASGRWSAKRKKAIFDSRIIGTRNLVASINKLTTPIDTLISSSAIGIYGDRGEEVLNELSAYTEDSNDFLANVCNAWEAEAKNANTRTVLVRTGIVLSPAGGALEKMLPPFQLGVAGPLGSGKHWMSWIHIDDLVNLFIFALENTTLNGPINGVAPGAVPNKDFTRVLAKVLGRPAFFPTPALVLKLIFGEMSSILLGSQHVKPQKLQTAGFKFEHPELQGALDNLFRNRGETGNKIEQVLWIPKPVNEVFDFFSSPNNLERITPPWLNFRITKKSSENVVEGMLIDYKLRVHFLPIRWRTRIEEWAPGDHFIDRQLKGPYKLWYHEHSFEPLAGGTLMKDCVVYRLPFGVLGDLVNAVWVKWDVAKIFSYRSKVISDVFGVTTPKTEPQRQIPHTQPEHNGQH